MNNNKKVKGTFANSRGIRNNNPFNIRRSESSWRGKLLHGSDFEFEQFQSIWYGLRAGFLLLRNGYLLHGYTTVESIIYRYAPASENNTEDYINFVITEFPALSRNSEISINSLTFFWLCQAICRYESRYELTYENYQLVINKFRLW